MNFFKRAKTLLGGRLASSGPVAGSGVSLPFEPVSPHEAKLREYFEVFDFPEGQTPITTPVCIMLFTNRSGSSLVSEYLRASPGFAGFGEPLNYKLVINRCEREGIRSFAEYLQWEMDKLERDEAGALPGMKASWGQAMMLMRSGAIPALFADVRWLVIRRRDLLSQAVSFSLAEQTQRWHSFDRGEVVQPKYDYDDIRGRIRGLTNAYSAIDALCAVFDLQPLQLVHEDFVADPLTDIARIATFLGVDIPATDTEQLRMKKQAGGLAADFRERFIADSRDRIAGGAEPRTMAGPQ